MRRACARMPRLSRALARRSPRWRPRRMFYPDPQRKPDQPAADAVSLRQIAAGSSESTTGLRRVQRHVMKDRVDALGLASVQAVRGECQASEKEGARRTGGSLGLAFVGHAGRTRTGRPLSSGNAGRRRYVCQIARRRLGDGLKLFQLAPEEGGSDLAGDIGGACHIDPGVLVHQAAERTAGGWCLCRG